MPVVYAILCHHSSRYVGELVHALYHPEQTILLHADAKAPPGLHAAARDLAALLPNVHVVDSVLCSWGGWSLVEATLRAIGVALALPARWRHFCLLSEQHLPLHPPGTIAKLLPEGASFSDAMAWPAMDADHRRDLRHRFSRLWRELPGVGMFSTGGRRASDRELAGFRLGSQWLVLARDACEYLWAARDDAALWAPFRASLVPDETALISVLRRGDFNIRKTSGTFVAWPHLGGAADSGFDDDHVRAARARGHLFIRKRPRILPPFMAGLLASFPDRPRLPAFPSEIFVADPRVSAFCETLPGATMGFAPPGEGPACCLEFTTPGQAPALSLHLLSHDFVTFKLLLAWRRPFDGALEPIKLAGYEATILGARLPGLTLAREVHLPEIPDAGFISADLPRHIETALSVARALSPLV